MYHISKHHAVHNKNKLMKDLFLKKDSFGGGHWAWVPSHPHEGWAERSHPPDCRWKAWFGFTQIETSKTGLTWPGNDKANVSRAQPHLGSQQPTLQADQKQVKFLAGAELWQKCWPRAVLTLILPGLLPGPQHRDQAKEEAGQRSGASSWKRSIAHEKGTQRSHQRMQKCPHERRSARQIWDSRVTPLNH
jgi:hypothetical protein